MNTNVINKSDIISGLNLKGSLKDFKATLIMSALGLNKINRLYSSSAELKGQEFTDSILKRFDIKYNVNPKDLENIPKEGPFFIVSNHPFGGADGLIMYDIVSRHRPDLKIMANFILSLIPNLKSTFIAVNPFENKGLKASLPGIRTAIQHIESGGCLGLFPAGEVSTYHGNKFTEDIPWGSSVIKMIERAQIPVVPLFFEGQNSRFFHFIGKIHPSLRTIMLPRELLKRRGKTVNLSIGKPITYKEIENIETTASLGAYLRARTYALEGNLHIPDHSFNNKIKHVEEIAPERDPDLICAEIEKAKDHLLFETSVYQSYIICYNDNPNIIYELGRAREITFRNVGEGTGKSLDLDEYDKYYKHLILWDKENKQLVGAYRLGLGKELLRRGGFNAFYSHSLLKYNSKAKPILEHSIELGRSFVSVDYQKEPLPLMLLIKGLLFCVLKYTDCKYLIGPVSISAWYPPLYRSLISYFLRTNYMAENMEEIASPRTPFKPDYCKVDPKSLFLQNKTKSIESFDKLLWRISNGNYRLPTLVKKYIKLNTRILDFNVDVDFNYCLDALIILDLLDIPKDDIIALSKECDNTNEILQRFKQ